MTMVATLPLPFESSAVRIQIDDGGQPRFNASEVCEAPKSHVNADDPQKLEVIEGTQHVRTRSGPSVPVVEPATAPEPMFIHCRLASLPGPHAPHKGGRFPRLLTDSAPNTLSPREKRGWPIVLPSGHKRPCLLAGPIVHGGEIGVPEANKGYRFADFRAEIGPKALVRLQKLRLPFSLPATRRTPA
jgi:hypothetical protein